MYNLTVRALFLVNKTFTFPEVGFGYNEILLFPSGSSTDKDIAAETDDRTGGKSRIYSCFGKIAHRQSDEHLAGIDVAAIDRHSY